MLSQRLGEAEPSLTVGPATAQLSPGIVGYSVIVNISRGMPRTTRTLPTSSSVFIIVPIRCFGRTGSLAGSPPLLVGAGRSPGPSSARRRPAAAAPRLPQWSRPPLLLICGVRPISPQHDQQDLVAQAARLAGPR